MEFKNKSTTKSYSSVNINNAPGGAASVLGSITNIVVNGKDCIGVVNGSVTFGGSSSTSVSGTKRKNSEFIINHWGEYESEGPSKKKAKVEVRRTHVSSSGNTTTISVTLNRDENDVYKPVPKEILSCVVCSQCKDRLKTVIKPCGHSFYCKQCSDEYIKIKKECPKCEGPIEQIAKIYS